MATKGLYGKGFAAITKEAFTPLDVSEYKVKDLAGIFGVTRAAISAKVKRGTLPPPTRVDGKSLVWSKDAIENFFSN